jgi:hypothetical protein
MKANIENIQMNGQDCVPIKPINKTSNRLDLTHKGYSLSTPAIEKLSNNALG